MAYLTVAEELVEYAEVARAYYRSSGYIVRIEPEDITFPFTPTFSARLQHTTVLCDVQRRLRLERVTSWVQYAKTCNRDTRIVVILPESASVKSKDEQKLAGLGVGILMCDTSEAYLKLTAKDQALSLELPLLKTLPGRVGRLLAPSYEKFGRGDWRDGFKSACQVLEVEARMYLKDGIARGRIQLVTDAGNPAHPSIETIEHAPPGRLAGFYAHITSPNKAEAVLEQALRRLNDDRVMAIHYERRRQTESSLRRNVGQHMFVIINALKTLYERP